MIKLSTKSFFILVLIFSFLASVIILFTRLLSRNQILKNITTFDQCAAAGYPILEIYPEQCRTPDGRTFTRLIPIATPSPITISGTYTCLPKKDTGGPVTLECALGLKVGDEYYALDTSAITSDNYPTLTGNEKITIEGNLVPIEMISSDRFFTYDVVGIISVEKITLN